MDDNQLKKLVSETGRILLDKQLVARTWGNISARKDDTKFAISPSGLGYENMQPSDVPIFDYETETWEGSRKPSSEKKIHAAAYKLYKDVNFVIHTHQDYATAVGLVGVENLKMTAEEKVLLGEVTVAAYGLPGTGKLKDNVEAALRTGSKVVLMKHHGALILGTDREDAINKAEVLETVCRRVVDEKIVDNKNIVPTEELSPEMKAACKDMVVISDKNLLLMGQIGGFRAQLDDMAQMLGKKLRAVENDDKKILSALNKVDAVLVKNVGCVILTEAPDDTEALKLLITKAAMAKRYTLACGVNVKLSSFDCNIMRQVYKMKYSKKKEG